MSLVAASSGSIIPPIKTAQIGSVFFSRRRENSMLQFSISRPFFCYMQVHRTCTTCQGEIKSYTIQLLLVVSLVFGCSWEGSKRNPLNPAVGGLKV